MVPPDRGFKTAGDFVTAAKAKPGVFNFSSPGVGSASHLSAERFRLTAGVQAVHVPFKGGVEAMTEVIAGRIDFFFVALGAALPHIRDGKLAALAVNSAMRLSALPDVPTSGRLVSTMLTMLRGWDFFCRSRRPARSSTGFTARRSKRCKSPR